MLAEDNIRRWRDSLSPSLPSPHPYICSSMPAVVYLPQCSTDCQSLQEVKCFAHLIVYHASVVFKPQGVDLDDLRPSMVYSTSYAGSLWGLPCRCWRVTYSYDMESPTTVFCKSRPKRASPCALHDNCFKIKRFNYVW